MNGTYELFLAAVLVILEDGVRLTDAKREQAFQVIGFHDDFDSLNRDR